MWQDLRLGFVAEMGNFVTTDALSTIFLLFLCLASYFSQFRQRSVDPAPLHHPTRLRRLVELAIPHNAKRSMSRMLLRLLCGVENIRPVHVVPKRAEQTGKVLLRPLMPRPFPKRAHEKTHPPSQLLRKGGGHATGSRYDAHVLRDLDWKAPARPRQHPSCTAMLLLLLVLLAAASSATAAAALLVVSYSFVLVFVFRQFFFPSYCYRAGCLLWNADADFSLLVLKMMLFEDLSCISVRL